MKLYRQGRELDELSRSSDKAHPETEEYAQYRCPICGAYTLNPRGISVKWNDSQKLFVVKASFGCPSCARVLPRGDMGTLPLVIARTSRCSCGKTLSLSQHSIKKVGDDLTFEGVYVCRSCHTAKSVIKDGLVKMVTEVWEKTKLVKVGPDGFEFEKK